MPELRNYHILISHSWSYDSQYKKVCSWFDNAPYFLWSDYSVSADDPFANCSKAELKDKLANQIMKCSCIVVLSGMYVAYSEWIEFEISCAKFFKKPIIGVLPWGNERVPEIIKQNATVLVGWNSDSVVNAVRTYSV